MHDSAVQCSDGVDATADSIGPVLTVPEAAGVLRVSERTAWSLVGSGRIPTVRIGRRRLVPRTALDAYVAGLTAA